MVVHIPFFNTKASPVLHTEEAAPSWGKDACAGRRRWAMGCHLRRRRRRRNTSEQLDSGYPRRLPDLGHRHDVLYCTGLLVRQDHRNASCDSWQSPLQDLNKTIKVHLPMARFTLRRIICTLLHLPTVQDTLIQIHIEVVLNEQISNLKQIRNLHNPNRNALTTVNYVKYYWRSKCQSILELPVVASQGMSESFMSHLPPSNV